MRQADLNRAVARATGETLAEIEHRGFSLVELSVAPMEPEPGEFVDPAPQMIDWDEYDLDRQVAVVDQPLLPEFA